MSMDGIWTFVIPERQGGGVLFVRDGKIYGGDIGYYFEGKCVLEGDAVQGEINAHLFNPRGVQQSVWGDHSEKFHVKFHGKRSGDSISGKIQRTGIPAEFALTLTRRDDLP